ncbi:hypothetical protein VSAK1_06435 [Vibrio mediterranei AK1]|jgi:hypothetical protein|nr:hypothetical protein VSAK1_06435 [Vibrio mediterranei AK1]
MLPASGFQRSWGFQKPLKLNYLMFKTNIAVLLFSSSITIPTRLMPKTQISINILQYHYRFSVSSLSEADRTSD